MTKERPDVGSYAFGAAPCRIYCPSPSVMQAGRWRAQPWVLVFEPHGKRWIEPLIGWTATEDAYAPIRMTFPTRAAAVDYAERYGLDYRVQEPTPQRRVRKSYRETIVRSVRDKRDRMEQQEETMNFGSLMPWRDRNTAPARRDDMLDPFVSFRREFDRIFDDFFNGFGGRGMQAMTPALDVAETDKEVVVKADLPGLDEKDFEVMLAGDILTIKGEKKSEHQEGDGGYTERRYGAFSRSLRLPFVAGDQNVDASYDKGGPHASKPEAGGGSASRPEDRGEEGSLTHRGGWRTATRP